MGKKHRTMLNELMNICNSLGGTLDSTATSESKFIDRQRAHMLVSDVIYGILADHKNNENASEDFNAAIESLEKLKLLKNKIYPDRRGII